MRRPRLELPDVPQHITQRGVNRAAVFLDDEDCACYLQALKTAAKDKSIAIHAYVLMTNHVHLLVGADAPGLVSQMMQAVGRRYVRAFNARHGLTGTLWEGRYKSCLVDSDRYLLACLRYIELNPVRAAMVQWPWEHRWSSIHVHLGLIPNSRTTPHGNYLALGQDTGSQATAYRAMLLEPLTQEQVESIRDHLRQERASGSPRFQTMVEKTLQRPALVRPAGRPRTHRNADSNAIVL